MGYGLDTVRGNAAHPVNRGLACQRGIRESADPEQSWYPFDDGESPAPTDADGQPISADD